MAVLQSPGEMCRTVIATRCLFGHRVTDISHDVLRPAMNAVARRVEDCGVALLKSGAVQLDQRHAFLRDRLRRPRIAVGPGQLHGFQQTLVHDRCDALVGSRSIQAERVFDVAHPCKAFCHRRSPAPVQAVICCACQRLADVLDAYVFGGQGVLQVAVPRYPHPDGFRSAGGKFDGFRTGICNHRVRAQLHLPLLPQNRD